MAASLPDAHSRSTTYAHLFSEQVRGFALEAAAPPRDQRGNLRMNSLSILTNAAIEITINSYE
jgi:hypothetical protein